MESSTASTRTHFEVLGLGLDSKVFGLGLQAYKSSKMPCCSRGQHYFLICKKWAEVMSFFFSSSWRARQRPRGKFKKTFFCLENTCALCPWSLALASSISVLGLERIGSWPWTVLCSWPWPRALCL